MMRHVLLLTREELIRGQAFQSLSCHPVFTWRAALKILWEICTGQSLFHLRQVILRQFFFLDSELCERRAYRTVSG